MKHLKLSLLVAALIVLVVPTALAYERGTFVLRTGIGVLSPKMHSLDTQLDLGEDDDTLRIDVSSATSVAFSGTYMFTESWGIDLVTALPYDHDIRATSPDPAGGNQTVKVARTKQMPIMLSVQYRFLSGQSFRPYFGLGASRSTFSSTRFDSTTLGSQFDKIELSDSTGLSLQLGGDWLIGTNAIANWDIRWISTNTKIDLSGPDADIYLGSADIDPMVYSLSIGFHF